VSPSNGTALAIVGRTSDNEGALFMEQKFRRILCPVDFDDNSMQALETAANLARENNGGGGKFHEGKQIHRYSCSILNNIRLA
jgi:hypothetical protein